MGFIRIYRRVRDFRSMSVGFPRITEDFLLVSDYRNYRLGTLRRAFVAKAGVYRDERVS